jgi:Protein of unknown function (DUF3014)
VNEDSRKWIYWAIPVAVVIGLGVALYYGRQHQPQVAEPPAPSAPAAPSTEPAIKHPLPEGNEAQPLPPLAESDQPVQEALGGVFGPTLDSFLIPRNLIRHFVVTVDNLPRKKTAVQMWPVKPTPGQLVIGGGADQLTLSPENSARYAPLVKLVGSADAAQIAALYKRYYPLLQQAYADLGYPNGYFNDRLVEVIDHLLATPEITEPIRLTQPSVAYQFADASLEDRSAGQKLLLRMGNENAAAIKSKLRELRKLITQPEATKPAA